MSIFPMLAGPDPRSRALRRSMIRPRAGRGRSPRLGVAAGAVLSVAAAGACGTPSAPKPESAAPVTIGAVERLSSPATGSSTAPQLTVSGNRVILSWLELANFRATLKFSELTGAGWSEAQVVAAGEGLIDNAADVPSVRALADGTLVAHWLQADGPDPEEYLLPLSWSKDGGKTWSKPINPHHDGTKAQHGFASLFQAAAGGLGVVWLDGRAMTHAAHGAADASMALWAATFDRTGAQIGEMPVDPRVCECCQTSVAETPDGILVAYRDRSPDEIRDIYVTRLDNGRWTAPARVHEDGWKIEGCPVNGPAVTANGREAAVAWFTVAGNRGRTLVAFSHDAGRTFGDPISVDDGSSSGHIDAELLPDGAVAVSWTEFVDEQSQVRLRRIAPDGSRSDSRSIGVTAGTLYPRLARAGDELIFTWIELEKGGFSRVRTGRAPLLKP